MDVRLPAEVRRPLQVSGPVRFVPQIGQAAPVDPLGPARPLKRPVRRLLPRLAGLLQPVPGLGRPRFLRPPPLLRGLPVVALEPLLARKETLKQELKARKKELQEAQRRHRDNLQKQIRRAQARLSSAERKQLTRRLILLGSYLEHVTGDDPHSLERLMKELDGFLERDRDREMFNLAPRPKDGKNAPINHTGELGAKKMRNRATIYVLTVFFSGAVFLLSSCAEPPVEPAEQVDPYERALEVLDNECDESANAFYLKVDGDWRFRPCDGCETVSIVPIWGGNTGGEREIEKVLEELSADLPNQEVSMLQVAQHTGACP